MTWRRCRHGAGGGLRLNRVRCGTGASSCRRPGMTSCWHDIVPNWRGQAQRPALDVSATRQARHIWRHHSILLA